MADSLKEIYNATITLSNVASTGALTVATTDASTQYVIKDVQVTGTLVGSTSPVLTVNDMPVANAQTNASGSEIVDINSTIKYRAFSSTPSIQYKNFKGFTGTNNFYTNTSGVVNGAVATTSAAADSMTVVTNSINANYAVHSATASNGDVYWVYWNSNDTCTLYKRAGGPNGTETAQLTLSYGWCVFNDVDSYFYTSNGSSVVNKYNINTQTTTSLTYDTALASVSYPSAYYMNNGFIVICQSGNSDTTRLIIINSANTTCVKVTVSDQGMTGANSRVSGYFDSITNRYTLFKKQVGTMYKIGLESVLPTTSGVYAGSISEQGYTLPTNYNNNNYFIHKSSNSVSWALHGITGKTELSTYNFDTKVTSTEEFLPFKTSTSAFSVIYTAGDPATFSSTTTMRITGIKTV